MHRNLNINDSLEESKDLLGWVEERLGGLRIRDLPDNRRLQLAMGCQHLAIEHAQAIVVLVDNQLCGSALALQRPLFEAVIRGIWLRCSATDEEVTKAEQGKFPRTKEMTRVSRPLEILRDRWWERMCGYTHPGREQILARIDSTGIRENYEPHEIVAALRWSDMIHLYCGVEMANAACNEALAEAFRERINTYEGTPYEEESD